MGTIAAIIPAYNAAAYIGEALGTIADQERPPDQVIVVDDCSSDETWSVVERWRRDHPGLSVTATRHDRNLGPSAARNTAVALATTDYVALLDADDRWLPATLRVLAEPLDSIPRAILSFGDVTLFGEGATPGESFLSTNPAFHLARRDAIGQEGLIEPQDAFLGMIVGNFVPQCACLMRRRFVIEAGLWPVDLRTSEDRHLGLRLARLGAFFVLPTVLGEKRRHSGQATRPGNEIRLTRNALQVLAAVPREFTLAPRERAQVASQTRQLLGSLMYYGSLAGPSALMSASIDCFQAGHPGLALSPRHWARMLRTLTFRDPHHHS